MTIDTTSRGAALIAAMRKRLPEMPNHKELGIAALANPSISVNASNNNIVVVANTDDVDADEEVLVPSGAIPDSYFFRNKSMFTDHEADFARYVAKMRTCRPWPSLEDHRMWRVTCQVLAGMGRPDADFILAVASDPSLGIGVSVGFAPLDQGPPTPEEKLRYPGVKYIIRKWDWLELSFTPAPCNVSCRTLGAIPVDDALASKRLALAVKHRPSAAACKAWGVEQTRKPRHVVVVDGSPPMT